MRYTLRSLTFGLAATMAAALSAQLPYTLVIQGTISGCVPFQQVTVETLGGASPMYDYTLEVFPNSCFFDTIMEFNGPSVSISVSTQCNGTLLASYGSVLFNNIGDTAVLVMNIGCNGGGMPDCLGLLNGPNMPGTPCNDNDPLTVNDVWSPTCACQGVNVQNCQSAFSISQIGPWAMMATNQSTGIAPLAYQWWMPDGTTSTATNPIYTFPAPGTYGICLTITASNACTSVSCDTIYVDSTGTVSMQPGYYDCMGIPNGGSLPGTPCDDGNPVTINDTWDAFCNCVGVGGGGLDCLGIQNGPNLPGTPCNDGDPNTINDLWSPNCACIGVVLPPSSVFVTGTVSPCNGGTYPVHIFTTGTTPPIDTLLTTGPNCTYAFLFSPLNTSGWVNVEVSCDSGLTWMWDSLGFTSTPGDTLLINFSCGGLITDCTGIPGGSNLPGTACDDGDTLTVQDTWTIGCSCIGVPVNYYDCLGQLNGPELPGTPCDDGNPATINDTWSANCVCVGGNTTPCQADFWVLQGFTVDSLNNPSPIPYELWVWNLSSGGSGTYSFLWNFGDGSSSTAAFPSHTYAGNGPYLLCLTIDDGAGCFSTSCDSVSIDNNGLYTGIMGGGNDRQNGFTINVQDPLSSGVNEGLDLDGIAAWPNPVVDELNIALSSVVSGAADVTVLDVNGRVVMAERRMLANGRNQLLLPTSTLSPGLYTVRISNGNASISQRFVKAN
jgi:PKD repeat protein